MSDSADRTIPATPRRREAARRQGAMPAAAGLSWVASAAVVVLLLPGWARATLPAATDMLRGVLRTSLAADAESPAAGELLPVALLMPSLGLVLSAAVAGLAVRIACDGIGWHPGRVAPDLARIDPLSGIRRIFSARVAWGTIGNAIAVMVVAGVAVFAVGPLFGSDAVGDSRRAAVIAWRQLGWFVAAAAAVAACQYAVGRLRFEQAIRMTPQEFADEQKSMQADPKVRLMQQRKHKSPGA